MIRTATVALALQLIAFAAFAQTAEYGRTFGGEITTVTKDNSGFSGSLGFMRSSGGRNGYEGTLGGSLMNDRLWFFGSVQRLPGTSFGAPNFQAVDAKATAQPLDWTTISASFSQQNGAAFTSPHMPITALPSSFLSLRSTSVIRDNMMFSMSFTRRTVDGR